MTFDRRHLLGASLGLGATATLARAAEQPPQPSPATLVAGLKPDTDEDQTAALQAAIDAAAESELPLLLPPGRFVVADLRLRAGTRLSGTQRATTLAFAGGEAFITADKAGGLMLQGIVFDGLYKPFDQSRGDGLLSITRSSAIRLEDLVIRNSSLIGLSLTGCGGAISNTTVSNVLDAGIKSLDSSGIDITGNTISECANNGILVWRSKPEEDGSTVTGNRISKIRNSSGGSGQYGNGINVYRAGSVLVANNRISDCAYTAVRGNSASNIQIVGNSCERLGEVALYAEFAFEGALIANNLVDQAASGISVTNFNEGGRLAVVQGNLIRNLFRREQEPEDKRGEGIGVEADAVVTGNTIENAPTVGIQVGWGPAMRNVSVTGNVVRRARVGISVTATSEAGQCLVANNLIADAQDGAIRKMQYGVVLGPDLAKETSPDGRIQLSGNLAV